MQALALKDADYSYDEVPYLSHSYSHTHPDHLAVIGSLFGLTPPQLETARVLELGSAGGGNIFPLALRYPKASFTGIDLSRAHVASAEQQAAALGLKNAVFRQQDILAFDLKAHRGAFDYIICHGVYSWVPEEVSARILDICRECLSAHGLAMISYNTLPGWNAVRSLRDMMRFHSERFATPEEKTSEARRLLKFLANAAPEGSSHRSVIEEEIRLLSGMDDSYLYHDHLEGINRQFYFHQFLSDAKGHGLEYVGDSDLGSMFVENLPQKAVESLKAINDAGLQEQYVDFVLNRRFRCSILCRPGVAVSRSMQNTKILDYCLTARMTHAEREPNFRRPVRFVLQGGRGAFTAINEASAVVYDEIVKSGIRPIPARDVVARAQQRLQGAVPGAAQAALVDNGLRLALRGFLSLHMNSPAFASVVSERPAASPLARLQVSQAGCRSVTTLLGGSVRVEGLGVKALPLFDGSRTLDEIARAAAANPANIAALAAQLAKQALLVA